MSIRYGFQRLVLLASAGYQRAELPLDDSVSLIAPNNTGKTSLINALQFLLIINKKRMDFGAHDWDKTRRFYFPNNSSYILLEAMLPEAGSVVLGCVVKGVSHDYEYFAYRGNLEPNDYRVSDGTLVSQPELYGHLARNGRTVSSYTPSEFAELIYGGRKSKSSATTTEFTIFRLEHPGDAAAFQRVLTRTLKLDKLRSQDVKAHLLEIFRRDLPDATIDFKLEWDKAFSEVNADREQFKAAVARLDHIKQLESWRDERLQLRGKLAAFRPVVEQRLGQWQRYYDETKASNQAKLVDVDREVTQLFKTNQHYARIKIELEKEISEKTQLNTRQSDLEQRFALSTGRGMFEKQVLHHQEKMDMQIMLVKLAQSQPKEGIERRIKRTEAEKTTLERELRSQSDNLYLRLIEVLDQSEYDRLTKVFCHQVLTLPPNQFELQSQDLKALLDKTAGSELSISGLKINLHDLSTQFQQRTKQEIIEQLGELQNEHRNLKEQLQAATKFEDAIEKKILLQHEYKSAQQDLDDYDLMTELKKEQPELLESLERLNCELIEVDSDIQNATTRNADINRKKSEIDILLSNLDKMYAEIERRRNQRSDQSDHFSYLADLPHIPWVGSAGFEVEDLADRLYRYQSDCNRLIDLNRYLSSGLDQLHASGLTKYKYSENDELELTRIIDFSHSLSQEEEALEKKARSAVVNVTASLREFRDGLRTLKARMRVVNQLISRRHLSDLGTFKIEPLDEERLVSAIELLITTAEEFESGESFELFNQSSVLDDSSLDQAKQTLIEEGNARQGLKIEDLFRLTFVVGKVDGVPESFDDLDSAASNGTVLMAKLVTGLAMLHLMQDKRHDVTAICYLDEALALDAKNQKSLIATAAEFGFALIFASPAPLTTARYCVPIQHQNGWNHITRKSWQIIELLEHAS